MSNRMTHLDHVTGVPGHPAAGSRDSATEQPQAGPALGRTGGCSSVAMHLRPHKEASGHVPVAMRLAALQGARLTGVFVQRELSRSTRGRRSRPPASGPTKRGLPRPGSGSAGGRRGWPGPVCLEATQASVHGLRGRISRGRPADNVLSTELLEHPRVRQGGPSRTWI